LGIVYPFFLFGALLIIAAVWYYLAIRWVDKNGRWS
jgi:hypothetical protein